MIICQTPFRVSFFGGGTDYPTWVKEHGGSVISTAINKYGYISCRYLPPFFEYKHRIVYSKIELINNIPDIVHPAVRAIFQHMGVDRGLEIHYDGDIPAQSGIGSSSSFTVGLINAIHALRGVETSKKSLAEEAIFVEQKVIKEAVGSQDQIAAAYGGLNRINFLKNGSFEVVPLQVRASVVEDLQSQFLLFFTGFSRISEVVAKSKIENFEKKKNNLFEMMKMVDEAQRILMSTKPDLRDFGKMLHESWLLKRELSEKVSNSSIDEIYETGLRHGAIGGKILGAGGGGFILFQAPAHAHEKIRRALSSLVEVPFEFDYQGSRIVLYNSGFEPNVIPGPFGRKVG